MLISVENIKKIANRIQKNHKQLPNDEKAKLKVGFLHNAIAQAIGYRDFFHLQQEEKNKTLSTTESKGLGEENKTIEEQADAIMEKWLHQLNQTYPGLDLVEIEAVMFDFEFCMDVQSFQEEVDEVYDEYGRLHDELIDKHLTTVKAPPGWCYYKALDKNQKPYLLMLFKSHSCFKKGA